jgi:hypothetical protein
MERELLQKGRKRWRKTDEQIAILEGKYAEKQVWSDEEKI